MARQLQAQGQPVATLVLIDSQTMAGGLGNVGPITDDQIEGAFLMDLTRASGAAPRTSGPGEDWGDLVTGGAKIAERLAAEFGPERLERLQAVFKANFLALSGYSPEPFAGRPVLIRAQGHVADGLFDSTMGWSALATEGVDHPCPSRRSLLVAQDPDRRGPGQDRRDGDVLEDLR